MSYIEYPNINPYIIKFGELGITWYSLSYVLGILLGWVYARYLLNLFNDPTNVTKQHLSDFISWIIIGIVIGGRMGHVIFYDPEKYLADPIEILRTYHGGMSFHGALVGTILSIYFFSVKYKLDFRILADIVATSAPLGLFLGRIANFINGELWGRPTEIYLPWAMVFPHADDLPRHPSQIYEALSEGLLLFFIMWFIAIRGGLNKRLYMSGMFLIFYGIARIFCEFFREPDWHIGYLYSSFTYGQLLSLPMIILGTIFIYKRNDSSKTNLRRY